MAIVTAGKTDVSSFFEKSGILSTATLSHTPFLVFNDVGSTVEVHIIDNIAKLMTYSDSTKVMAQWVGQRSSDFFQFTVGQVRMYLEPLSIASREQAIAMIDSIQHGTIPDYVQDAFLQLPHIAHQDDYGQSSSHAFGTAGAISFRKEAHSPNITVEVIRSGRKILRVESPDRGHSWQFIGAWAKEANDLKPIRGVLAYLGLPNTVDLVSQGSETKGVRSNR